MRCSAVALGASLIALALTAGPAFAEPGLTQTVDDSTGAAQVGAVAVDAPVRVASDGDGSSAGVSGGAPQTTSESTGAAQVTSVDANAPVRVLSDGNDAEAASSGVGAGEQTTGDSTAAAQVGSADVDAPVRVLSDGDNAPAESGGASAGEQSAAESTGAAQVGSPSVAAPVRVLSEDGGTSDEGGAAEDVGEAVDGALAELVGDLQGNPGVPATPSELAPGADGPRPVDTEVHRLIDHGPGVPETQPAVDLVPGYGGGAEVATLSVAAASLPYTGSDAARAAAIGLWLLSTGLALRLVPGGKRR
jgi:hypothetical protein